MNDPAISATIPTHNRPELMSRAVQSVANQTYSGMIEIIVVFDACDPMLPKVDLPPNRTLRALTNQRSRGLAGSRNTGIIASAHDYVAFLDDDDTWAPTKIDRQMRVFESSPQAILVGTAMVVDDGERTHERLIPGEKVTRNDLLHNRLAGLHSSSFLFRKSALLGDLGLIDEELPRSYGEDYDILLRTASIEPITVINEPLVNVRWQGQSYFFGRWALYAQALQYLLAKHPDFSSSNRAIGRIEAQIAFALAASHQRSSALHWARRALRHDKKQVKAVLAVLIALRLASAERVARAAQRFGKGI